MPFRVEMYGRKEEMKLVGMFEAEQTSGGES